MQHQVAHPMNNSFGGTSQEPTEEKKPTHDDTLTKMDKSNILLLGPTGSGEFFLIN